MSETRKLIAMAIGIALIAGCADTEITEVSRGGPLMGAHGAASIIVDGEWEWSREEILIFPSWVAEQIFGIEPEGPTTRARCSGSGTMTLNQTGDAFTGEAIGSGDNQCVTRGGQVFKGVATGLPQPIVDGQIRGRSLRFHLLAAGGSLDCALHAVISEIQAGEATAMKGGGSCILPGHPKSNVPVDPPPGGVDHFTAYSIVRTQ